MSFFPASLPGSLAPSSAAGGFAKTQAAIWIFGVLAAIFLAWPVWRIGLPLELSRNEPWNAWFTDRILNGGSPYPSADELIVNNYPPLSFYLTALAAKLTGDTILAGRLIALASTGLVAIAAGLCIRALGGSRAAAAFGGFWLLATLSRFFTLYAGVNDPTMLALALMGLGLAYFLQRLRTGRAVEPAIALMVLAGFVKHTMPDYPLAALIWLAASNKRAALRAAAFGAGLAAAGLALCALAFGPDFATQMLMPRVMSFKHIFFALNRLQWIAPALLFWGLWAWPNRKVPAVRFTALLLGLSLASGLFQATGAGVTYNAYFGVVFASAIAVALAFEGIASTAIARRYGVDTLQTAMIAVLVLRLLLSQHFEPYFVLTSASYREELRQQSAAANAEAARIRSTPGPIYCWPMSVCYRAGKAFVYDNYWAQQLIARGRWSKEAVEQAIRERGIRFETIDPRSSFSNGRLF
ncbi:MAG: hypothetical protein ACLP7P_15140 [Rhodomicrobium sp.]